MVFKVVDCKQINITYRDRMFSSIRFFSSLVRALPEKLS